MNGKPRHLMIGMFMTLWIGAGAFCARAEIMFGYNGRGLRTPDAPREFSRQGRFFATTDFADGRNDWGRLTNASIITETGRFPSYNRPWLSDGSASLFGVTFPKPIKPLWPTQFDRFPNKEPLFDRVVIQWGENVPAKGTLGACVQTPDGALKRINMDFDRVIYPLDRTTLRFEPTPVKTFYVGVKGGTDGSGNYAEVRDFRMFIAPDENKTITNGAAVWFPAFYLAMFDSETPGMIEGVTPVNAYSCSHHTLFYHPGYVFDLFFRMTPFLEIDGKKVFPSNGAVPVKTSETGDGDRLDYSLTFDVPGKGNIEATVTQIFRERIDRSLEFSYRADQLPDGVRLGYQFNGPGDAFAKFSDKSPLAGPTINLTSAAGETFVHLKGSESLTVSMEEKGDRVLFETTAAGKDLDIAFSLPIGVAGQPQPELLSYSWRPSVVGEGDEGIAPFKESDLELLDEIHCGDPNDPHPCHDLSNDPAIEAMRGTDKLKDRRRYGFMPLLDNPRAAAIPITTVLGERVRAIPDKRGVYVRYDLEAKLKAQTPYLVVVEHAFDQKRRGTFHVIHVGENNAILGGVSQILRGGFETGDKPENVFKKESVLCFYPLKRSPSPKVTASLVFTADWAWQGWEKKPGLAIKSIRLYRVKTMPRLPDVAPLLPPLDQRRSLIVLSEMCGGPSPWWLFQWPKLVGYDGLWTYNDPMSRLLGGSSNLERSFHPGTLAGNKLLFAAAADEAVSVNLHLGQLLNLGFGNGDSDSFTGSFHGSYNGNDVPFKPTKAELDHIAAALKTSLGTLANYQSLKEVSLTDNPQPLRVWTERNLRDFRDETGTKFNPSPFWVDNVHALLDAGPDVVAKWSEWACRNRHEFQQWLLEEIRKYRPDLRVVLCRCWYHAVLTNYESIAHWMPQVDKKKLADAGIGNFVDFLRFVGINPDLYKGESGFTLELEADAKLRIRMEEPLPDYYQTDWFRRVKDDFKKGGLSVMVNYNYDECQKPLKGKVMNFFKHRLGYRRGLIEALLQANARDITLPTYVDPWSGRLDDLRRFVIPYRLLPFAESEPYKGNLTDPAKQAVINRYGDRYGLINAGDKPTTVTLTLPSGKTTVMDFSAGLTESLTTTSSPNGETVVEIAMSPWSLKTLEMK